MRQNNRSAIRQLLRDHPDGLTTRQIASALYGNPNDNARVNHSLRVMPDCYIDRWMKTGGSDAAVWIAVPIPPHCPPPRKGRPGRPPKVQQAGASA